MYAKSPALTGGRGGLHASSRQVCLGRWLRHGEPGGMWPASAHLCSSLSMSLRKARFWSYVAVFLNVHWKQLHKAEATTG